MYTERQVFKMTFVLCFCNLLGSIFFSATEAIASEQTASEAVPGEIIVQLKDTAVSPRGLLTGFHIIEERKSCNGRLIVLKLPDEKSTLKAAGILARSLKVKRFQPNYIYRAHIYSMAHEAGADDPDYIAQWHFRMINLEEAWGKSNGENVVVAVLDSGVHPKGRDGFGDRLLHGYNAFLNLEMLWQDANCHGTHIAGTIAQETDNGAGVAGIAYKAKILPVKVLNRSLEGTTESITAGLYWAADQGADIINMSLGSDTLSEEGDAILQEAIDYAYDNGITMVTSAGNNNQSKSTPSVGYPARYEKVISVGAVDFLQRHASYSDGGPELDLVAPGGDRAWAGRGVLQETFSRHWGFSKFAFGWDYYYLAGTSMACPHVTGVAALIKSLHPDWGPEKMREALVNTAIDLGDAGHDDYYGYGLVNAAAAVAYWQ